MSTQLPAWRDRSQPAADVLNPAISAVCVAWSVARYENDTNSAFPFSLAFLVAPLTLHAPTRIELPRSVATHFPKWINDHAELLAGFPGRAKAFAPYTREGLRQGIRTGLLTFNSEGALKATIPSHTKVPQDTELRSIATASAIVGAWFARSGPPSNIYAQLGVTP